MNIQKRRPAIAIATRGPTTAPAIQALLLDPATGLGVEVNVPMNADVEVNVAMDADVDCDLVKLGAAVVEIEVAAVVLAVIE